jgi:hypothetical protein
MVQILYYLVRQQQLQPLAAARAEYTQAKTAAWVALAAAVLDIIQGVLEQQDKETLGAQEPMAHILLLAAVAALEQLAGMPLLLAAAAALAALAFLLQLQARLLLALAVVAGQP